MLPLNYGKRYQQTWNGSLSITLKRGIKIILSNVCHSSEFPTKFHFVIISTIVISKATSLCFFPSSSSILLPLWSSLALIIIIIRSLCFFLYSFLSLLVSKQQPTRKLCYFGCCTLIHNWYKLYNYNNKFSIIFVFYDCFFSTWIVSMKVVVVVGVAQISGKCNLTQQVTLFVASNPWQ